MDRFVLTDRKGRKRLIEVNGPEVRIPGAGKVDAEVLRASVGKVLETEGRRFLVLRPDVRDEIELLRRVPQIILAKDSASLALNLDLKAGDVVVEGGSGSGALTIVLARAVRPGGRVVSYERREDFAQVAEGNVAAAGLADAVEVKRADIAAGIAERGVDAVALDIPEPWAVVAHAHAALKVGGHFASYSPTMEQVRETVLELRRHPFAEVRSVELLEREIEVGRGTRPSFHMLAHTGYLTYARKVLERLA